MPSIDAVAGELSDLHLLDKSTKQLQASFRRPIPDALEGDLRPYIHLKTIWNPNEDQANAMKEARLQ